MSKSYLSSFRINNTVYEQYIDTNTDATALYNCEDKTKTSIFTVDSYAYVYDENSVQIGMFRTNNDNTWTYFDKNGGTIDTPFTYLIKAEAMVFKQLLQA